MMTAGSGVQFTVTAFLAVQGLYCDSTLLVDGYSVCNVSRRKIEATTMTSLRRSVHYVPRLRMATDRDDDLGSPKEKLDSFSSTAADIKKSKQMRELEALRDERDQPTTPISESSSTDSQDLFIPIVAVVSLVGLFGSYGYEVLRLASRGELYLPWTFMQ